MGLLGLEAGLAVLFVCFGLLIGLLFGFFGMGGSFLVMPALLMTGYPVPVAVGSGLAFVFGTSVIGALRHRHHGQIDYRLGALLILGMTLGIQIGTRIVFRLAELGSAELVVSALYVGLTGFVGAFSLWRDRPGRDGRNRGALGTGLPGRRLPPRITVAGDRRVSIWVVLGCGVGVGVLSGLLGVGGGFLLLPVMVYGLGVPVGVAVGTDILQITVSSAYGAFVYADADSVALPAVGALLAGSTFGTRIGAGATRLVDEAAFTRSFAVMLLAGSLSVGVNELNRHLGLELLNLVSVALVFGAPTLVGATIVLAAIDGLRRDRRPADALTR